jgi:hypothetical protein
MSPAEQNLSYPQQSRSGLAGRMGNFFFTSGQEILRIDLPVMVILCPSQMQHLPHRPKRSASLLGTPCHTNRHAAWRWLSKAYPQVGTQLLWMDIVLISVRAQTSPGNGCRRLAASARVAPGPLPSPVTLKGIFLSTPPAFQTPDKTTSPALDFVSTGVERTPRTDWLQERDPPLQMS